MKYFLPELTCMVDPISGQTNYHYNIVHISIKRQKVIFLSLRSHCWWMPNTKQMITYQTQFKKTNMMHIWKCCPWCTGRYSTAQDMIITLPTKTEEQHSCQNKHITEKTRWLLMVTTIPSFLSLQDELVISVRLCFCQL